MGSRWSTRISTRRDPGLPPLLPAGEVPIAFRPMLDHCDDCARCILDELRPGSFHGEVVVRVRDEWDLARSRIDHQAVPFEGDHFGDSHDTTGCFISTGVLSKHLDRHLSLLPALADQVWRVTLVLTDILNQLSVRDEIELDGKRPRPGVRL